MNSGGPDVRSCKRAKLQLKKNTFMICLVQIPETCLMTSHPEKEFNRIARQSPLNTAWRLSMPKMRRDWTIMDDPPWWEKRRGGQGVRKRSPD